MKNYQEALQFKKTSLGYHHKRAEEAKHNMNLENIHIFISEFCSMMEAISSCIHISRDLAYKQSPVEIRSFYKSLDENTLSELSFIEQFVIANRINNVFTVTDNLNIKIKPIARKRERGYYKERGVIPYMAEVIPFSEKIINDYMNIYFEGSSHYDQSWRIIDVNRASFSCTECGEMVTDLLSHIGNLSSILLKEKENYLPRRTYVYGHEIIKAELLPWMGVNEIREDELIIPIDGLYGNTRKEPAIGCCGPDSSTLNVLCRNGHPVGSEAADCYMPHFIRLPLSKIKRYEIIDG
ncbi:hypothetical protein [Paenibacillus sp. V4I7]|uniref:hypothetical protein n=1 Tax=Paenibacillus sp. V4I7 TaxID=3042307 RepID=UPI0027817956|nr:hypothetical protein [Paenibacillus sp. V4I7]MDQ0901263.1 hypothetical protein [Paenibacillus sp. V4I7]